MSRTIDQLGALCQSRAGECNRRILLIDDNHAIHEDYEKILSPKQDSEELEELGSLLFDSDSERPPTASISFELTSAFQGQEALELVKQSLKLNRPYAMAFVDMRMPPGWDGLETIKQIWRVDPELQIVICSAYSDHTWNELVEQLPMEDQWLLLRKPFDSAEVSQLALALSKKWNLQRDSRQSFRELQVAVDDRDALLNTLVHSMERAFSACSTNTDRMDHSCQAAKGVLQGMRRLQDTATADGISKSAWEEVIGACDPASAEQLLESTLGSMRESLEQLGQIQRTAEAMQNGLTVETEVS